MQKSQRLIQLIMMINAKKSFTVRELADEFGLSTRTITRDLQELSELGIPIYSIQGRGGGYKLLQDRMLPPISLSESEAIAMFFACQWFVPLCKIVSLVFTLAVVGLFIATLTLRVRVHRKYDRRKIRG